MRPERDWDAQDTHQLAKTAAAHSHGATKRLERIENLLWFIAILIAMMLGRVMGWY